MSKLLSVRVKKWWRFWDYRNARVLEAWLNSEEQQEKTRANIKKWKMTTGHIDETGRFVKDSTMTGEDL